MCINKDLNGAVVHPTKAYLQKACISVFSYLIQAQKNLQNQFFPEMNKVPVYFPEADIFTTEPRIVKKEENVSAVMSDVETTQLLPANVTNRSIINTFTGKKATTEQTHDMLNFRTLGQQYYENFVKYRILWTPSTSEAPQCKHHLLTMAAPKLSKQRITQKDKEHKLVTRCLRRRLAWCKRTGVPYNAAQEQYSVFPRALSDSCGKPNTGTKSYWTQKLKSRYTNILTEQLPQQWVPEVVILEGMFPINTSPLKRMKTVNDYTSL